MSLLDPLPFFFMEIFLSSLCFFEVVMLLCLRTRNSLVLFCWKLNKKYQNLKDNTDIGKTLKGIEKKVGVEITQRGRKMLNKQDYIKLQMESADNDFVNELLYEHYNNEVKNMSDQEFKNHLKNMGIDNESQTT